MWTTFLRNKRVRIMRVFYIIKKEKNMKKTFFLLSTIFFSLALSGQNDAGVIKQGTVIYKQVIKMDIKIDDPAMAKLIPKEQKSKKVLYFNEKASLYKNYEEKEADEMPLEQEGMVVKMSVSDDIIYTDFEKKIVTEQREFMTRDFLVTGKLKKPQWKLTGRQKQILGYYCQEAVKNDGENRITAWFTPEIPVPAGPGLQNGLPGLILAVNIGDGQTTWTAISVDDKPIEKSLLKKPKKGKKVTGEEYEKIVAEKLEEMGGKESRSGKNTSVITITIQK